MSTDVVTSTQLHPDGKRTNAASKWTFTATRDHDGKEFTCRSENAALKQPQKATIRMEVKYPPDVQLTVDRTHITEGDDLRFSCSATANPADSLVYKWYKNDEVVFGDVSTTLILPKVGRELNGAVIACEVTNAVGARRAENTLNINFGPVFKTEMNQVHGVELGHEARLLCDVDGNPTPEITWLFEKSPRVLSTESALVIPEMNYDTAGRYLCRASVRGFSEIAASTQVFIKGKSVVFSLSLFNITHRTCLCVYVCLDD